MNNELRSKQKDQELTFKQEEYNLMKAKMKERWQRWMVVPPTWQTAASFPTTISKLKEVGGGMEVPIEKL